MNALALSVMMGISFVTSLPQKNYETVHYDLIEVNIHCNEWGFPIFAQFICFDWHNQEHTFHVEYWQLMEDAFKKTEAGKKKWDALRREEADKIKHHKIREDFLEKSKYKGEFEGGKMYPIRNHSFRLYEAWVMDNHRLVKVTSKGFRKTYSQSPNDPERMDRSSHPEKIRRGLK